MAALIKANEHHLDTYLPAVARLATPDAAVRHLAEVAAAAERGQVCEWHIFRGDELCGAIRLHQIDRENRKAALACFLGAGQQGSGLATACLRAVIAQAFNRFKLNRIEWQCASDNAASERLAKRLGFAWEGMLRQAELLHGAYVDHFIYSLLREDAAPLLQSA